MRDIKKELDIIIRVLEQQGYIYDSYDDGLNHTTHKFSKDFLEVDITFREV